MKRTVSSRERRAGGREETESNEAARTTSHGLKGGFGWMSVGVFVGARTSSDEPLNARQSAGSSRKSVWLIPRFGTSERIAKPARLKIVRSMSPRKNALLPFATAVK